MKRFLVIVALCLPISAQGLPYYVHCEKPGPMGKVSTYLKFITPLEPNTLKISGTCKENIQINSFDRLSRIAVNGATLQDASDMQQPVVLIGDSQRVVIQGFNIVGGDTGISCIDKSICRLNSNTVTGAVNSGILVHDSEANLFDDKLLNNGGNGLTIDSSKVLASPLTVTGTNGFGLNVANSSSLNLTGGDIQNNQAGGIFLVSHSGLNVLHTTISNNAGAGIVVLWNSAMATYEVTVTNKNANGVYVEGNSTVDLFGGGTSTGNNLGGPDIFCGSHSGIAVNLDRVIHE